MTKAEKFFHSIVAEIPDTQEGKMFGALCIKAANGKAGIMLRQDEMIFKLKGEDEQQAMALKGASVFDPMGGRPMTGWICIPGAHAAKWKHYADISMKYVKEIEVDKTPKKAKDTVKKAK